MIRDLGTGARKGCKGIWSSSAVFEKLTDNKTYREWSAVSIEEMKREAREALRNCMDGSLNST
jgi:hypothetical protein